MNKQFIYQKDGQVQMIDAEHDIRSELSPDFYKVNSRSMGFFSMTEFMIDSSVEIPKSSLKICKEYINIPYIEKYFGEDSVRIHKGLGVKNKLSFLLSGKQGTGKTTAAYAISKYLIDKYEAIVVTVHNSNEMSFAINFLKEAKKQKNFLSVMIFDECEGDMQRNESYMKQMLDSSDSIDRHLFFFTTNYAEQIPDTIKDRPSRIKEHIVFEGIKDEEQVYDILNQMNNTLDKEFQLSREEIKSITPNMKDKTLDEIKNGFIDEAFRVHMHRKNLKEIVVS